MTRYRPEHYFTPEELRRIESAVGEAEKGTSGEVAVMVVATSGPYRDGEALGGALLAGFGAFLVSALAIEGSPFWFFPLTLLFFLPLFFLLRLFPPLSIVFVGAGREASAVRDAALKAFVARGLDRTRGRTGILFHLSLLERTVVVLADKGIYERIGQESLDRLAARVTRGMQEGKAYDELAAAVAEAGDLLRKHFPAGPEDIQELPDRVIVD